MGGVAGETQGPPLSLSAWEALPEDEPGELVDGRLVDEEMPDLAHETVVAWLVAALRGWIVARGGFVFGSEVRLVVGPRRGRKPDVCVYFPGARLPRQGAVRVPPEVVVEVVSSTPRDGRRDRVEKVDDYAAFGVRYYWIVDPEQRTLEVLELGADRRYVHAQGFLAGTVSPAGCEGLTLDLDALWAEVDRLEPGEPPPDVR